ncbi:MAG: bifunctional phosphoribosylaminoimidazolecarboxamide formyltransferase/IMP cyclohydrolase [Ignavibacteriales bacterium]|nr:bifunctional phosphoribosylaminoimidazolecarboxamide formyltransferase/IMP cyclohydrolase [Ignavibacteriales bacterium]
MKKIALISVSDKTDIINFSKKISENNYTILATGKTADLIIENNIDCVKIQDYTSFPEIFDGRVKTLHPKIFGGILFRRHNEKDLEQAKKNEIQPIDIVCVNLYPFPKVVDIKDFSVDEKIENIDIGGPSLIRAAAKNYKYISVITDPKQYNDFLEELEKGDISLQTRERLAADAFSYTSLYDTIIANYFENEFKFPKKSIRLNYPIKEELRYGENPHQKAFIFGDFNKYFECTFGKELSYNNIIDLTSAVELVYELRNISCAIIKHTNPCGAASGDTVLDAYIKALSSDPVSAFGGIVAFNNKVDAKTAEKLNEIFLEIVAAPDYDLDAIEILQKKKNRRIVKILSKPPYNKYSIKDIPGGLLVQDKDSSIFEKQNSEVVTEKKVVDSEYEDINFAWVVCKHTKSNAIVIVRDKKILGVGAGQTSRVDSAKIAIMKAKEFGHELKNSVAASDAFFPFPDGVIELVNNGITSIVQPGGSVRDQEVIDVANKNDISMIFTKIRNFKH